MIGIWALSLVLGLIVGCRCSLMGRRANVQSVSRCELTTQKVLMSKNVFQRPEVSPVSRMSF